MLSNLPARSGTLAGLRAASFVLFLFFISRTSPATLPVLWERGDGSRVNPVNLTELLLPAGTATRACVCAFPTTARVLPMSRLLPEQLHF